jgi:hypothetical protein
MNTTLEYSTRVVQEGGRRCKKSALNDLVHLTPLRIPLMNPPYQLREELHVLSLGILHSLVWDINVVMYPRSREPTS